MKKRRLLLLTAVMLAAQMLFAQTRTVTGKVTDAAGTPLPGVSVTVTATNASTLTDAAGNFSLSVPSGARSLTLTSVGYVAQTVALGSSNRITASLALSAGELAAVVVTGYGNVDRSRYAGASSKVSEAAIRNVPVGSFEQILQGRAPGLTVFSSGGQPGAGANVILRGPTSIEGGSAPLYVVDGIPVEAGVFQGINSNDIASVDVLKDASSAALYGSRGAAGVIVVTTKRGKSGKMRLGFSTQQGVKFAPAFGFTPMNSNQLLKAQEALGQFIPNSTLSPWGSFPTLPGWQYSDLNPNKLVGTGVAAKIAADYDFGRRQLDSLRGINTNWLKEFFDDARFSNNEISFSGGEGRTRLYTNLAYYQEDGILKPTNMKRVTLRTNADYKDEKLTLSLSSIVGYTRRNLQTNALNGFNNFINPFGVPQLTPTYITPTLPNGKYNTGAAFAFFAPTMLDKRAYDKVYNDQAKATLAFSVNYDFTKNVYAGLLGGIDFRETQNTTYNDPRPFNTRTSTNVRTRSGSVTEGLTRFFQPNGKAFVGYRNSFGNHSIDATVYAEVLKTYSKTFAAQGFGVDTLRPNTIAAVTAGNAANQLFQVVGGSRSQRTLNSLLGVVRYNFQNKYSLTGTYRYDGVSSLPEKNRFQGFYSIGVIWDAMREDFMKNVSFANALRLKFSTLR